jgi:hypothetical protein
MTTVHKECLRQSPTETYTDANSAIPYFGVRAHVTILEVRDLAVRQ